jgi:hypothetical protein
VNHSFLIAGLDPAIQPAFQQAVAWMAGSQRFALARP